jgi:hypothetical protein
VRPFRERRRPVRHDEIPDADDYHLPAFNLTVGVWHNLAADVTIPPTGPADARTPGQLVASPMLQAISAALGPPFFSLFRFPPVNPVNALVPAGNSNDVIEAPLGSGRCYSIITGEYVAFGFRNQYYLAVAARLRPTVGPPNP